MDEEFETVGEPKEKTKVIRGHKKGKPFILRMDPKLQRLFTKVRERNTRNWDYVSIVAGLPGSGKSTFAMQCARFCDPEFDETKIAFTAEQFIEITNNAKEYSAVILDESFQDLNSKSTMSYAFKRIINHLQIIRQKKLFIFLLIPNFFDFAKSISLYRSNHLFYIYEYDNGKRGRFRIYGRKKKDLLWIKGGKFMNYNAEKANFFGQYWNDDVVDEEKYLALKRKHLEEQEQEEKVHGPTKTLAKLLKSLIEEKILTYEQISQRTGTSKNALTVLKHRHAP